MAYSSRCSLTFLCKKWFSIHILFKDIMYFAKNIYVLILVMVFSLTIILQNNLSIWLNIYILNFTNLFTYIHDETIYRVQTHFIWVTTKWFLIIINANITFDIPCKVSEMSQRLDWFILPINDLFVYCIDIDIPYNRYCIAFLTHPGASCFTFNIMI